MIGTTHATFESLARLGYVKDGANSGWRCPFCKKYCENTNDAMEHQDHLHGTKRQYRVLSGVKMWLYKQEEKRTTTSLGKGEVEYSHSGSPQLSAKLVIYDEVDLCRTKDGHPPMPRFYVFVLPENSIGYQYVAFELKDVEVIEHAIQN